MKIDKVVVNMGVGEGGEKLIKAEKVLQILTNQKPVRTISRTTNKEWGIRKSAPIGCKVTLREKDAEVFLKNALWVRDNKLPKYSFSENGNLSFGISDYTDFPNMKYDPEIGIFGMDVCVSLKKMGARIMYRKRCKRKIPNSKKVSIEEAIEWMKKNFNLEVIE